MQGGALYHFKMVGAGECQKEWITKSEKPRKLMPTYVVIMYDDYKQTNEIINVLSNTTEALRSIN